MTTPLITQAMSSAKPVQHPLEKVIDHLFCTTEQIDRVRFYGWVLSQSHIQHHQHKALAAAAGVSPQAAEKWTAGINESSKAGVIYAKVRALYAVYGLAEVHMAFDFGDFLNRDFFEELNIDPGGLT